MLPSYREPIGFREAARRQGLTVAPPGDGRQTATATYSFDDSDPRRPLMRIVIEVPGNPNDVVHEIAHVIATHNHNAAIEAALKAVGESDRDGQ